MARSVVVFDLGGVLIDWNPRHLYRQLAGGDEARIEWFLANVCTHEWNQRQDAGRTFAEAAALLKAEHPDHADWIDAYGARFGDMLSGPIHGTVEILRALKAKGAPLYALTNWSAETFPIALERFDFLGWFDGILVSGVEKLIKPDPAIFRLLADRHGFKPEEAVFIDDVARNVAAAESVGFRGIHFSQPDALGAELGALGLL